MTRRYSVVGFSSGTVMYHHFVSGPAPSTSAASYSSAAGDREDRTQDDRGQRLVGAADPELRPDPENTEYGVREAVWIGVEDPTPHHRDEDRGVHQRQIEERAIERLTSWAERLKEARDDERERQLGGDDHRRVEDRVAEGLTEDRVFRERDEILQADE